MINYECPEDEKVYVHRIGRTGRAGASGVAITFVDWADQTRWKVINNTLGLPFEDRRRPTPPHRTSATILGSILQLRAESHVADRGHPTGRIGQVPRTPARTRPRLDSTRTRRRLRNGVPVEQEGPDAITRSQDFRRLRTLSQSQRFSDHHEIAVASRRGRGGSCQCR